MRVPSSAQVFDNAEISANVEETVTNHDVFVVLTRDDEKEEINFSLMQLMLFISALKGGGALLIGGVDTGLWSKAEAHGRRPRPLLPSSPLLPSCPHSSPSPPQRPSLPFSLAVDHSTTFPRSPASLLTPLPFFHAPSPLFPRVSVHPHFCTDV